MLSVIMLNVTFSVMMPSVIVPKYQHNFTSQWAYYISMVPMQIFFAFHLKYSSFLPTADVEPMYED
jgi:hypothetical protein